VQDGKTLGSGRHGLLRTAFAESTLEADAFVPLTCSDPRRR